MNNIWYLSCNFNINTENRNVHFSAQSVSECETDSILTQTQEIWHEEFDQKCMSENMQQAVKKKTSSSAIIINADWKRDQNLINRNMIKKWMSEEFFDIQNTVQQMKTMMKSREIWVRTARNQRIKTYYDQAACSSS